MTTVVAKYLKYANLQMAAEALYNLKTDPAGSTTAGEISPAMLNVGNVNLITLLIREMIE